MKNIIIYTILIISIIIFDYNIGNCAEKNVLFKEYYLGMTTDEAGNISNLLLKKDLKKENIKYFSTGTTEFASINWNIELCFYKNKLINVELSNDNTDDLFTVKILKELSVNNFFNVILCTKNNIYDILKIAKAMKSDDKNYLGKASYMASKERFFTSVFVDTEVYRKTFTDEQLKKTNDFLGIMKKYPNKKRIVVLRNYYNSYSVVFGTSLDALIAVSAHAEVAQHMNKQKTF